MRRRPRARVHLRDRPPQRRNRHRLSAAASRRSPTSHATVRRVPIDCRRPRWPDRIRRAPVRDRPRPQQRRAPGHDTQCQPQQRPDEGSACGTVGPSLERPPNITASVPQAVPPWRRTRPWPKGATAFVASADSAPSSRRSRTRTAAALTWAMRTQLPDCEQPVDVVTPWSGPRSRSGSGRSRSRSPRPRCITPARQWLLLSVALRRCPHK